MVEIWSNIPGSARSFLIAWIVLIILTLYLFWKKHKLFPWALGLSVFSLASAFALFTPYLYRWDEQFHALVGKNLSINPFHPKLIDIDPALWHPVDWANTYTWLHKQPLFLYQIALSIKLFGASVYAVRLPSILLHVIGTLAIFDMGKMMLNRNYGLLAALLFSMSAFPLGLLSGNIGTDHNDSVFMIYVLLSFWAWFKLYNSGDKKWVKWIGIFVGCAILTKWLVGLLIFAPWGIWIAINLIQKNQVDIKSYLKALGIALLISIPWQIYIFIRFPKIAKEEMVYNGRHFSEVIEGHPGGWDFHFLNTENLLLNNWLVIYLLFLSIITFYLANKKAKVFWAVLSFSSALVYVFFSIAATKMGSFIAPVFPFLILLITYPIAVILKKVKQPVISGIVLVSILFYGFLFLLNPKKVADAYGFVPASENQGVFEVMNAQWVFFDSNKLNGEKDLVINSYLRGQGSVSWQFQNGTKAISNIPNENEIKTLQNAGYNITCIQWKWGEPMPDYILSDSTIHFIQFE